LASSETKISTVIEQIIVIIQYDRRRRARESKSSLQICQPFLLLCRFFAFTGFSLPPISWDFFTTFANLADMIRLLAPVEACPSLPF
jgi:hypothetical protein